LALLVAIFGVLSRDRLTLRFQIVSLFYPLTPAKIKQIKQRLQDRLKCVGLSHLLFSFYLFFSMKFHSPPADAGTPTRRGRTVSVSATDSLALAALAPGAVPVTAAATPARSGSDVMPMSGLTDTAGSPEEDDDDNLLPNGVLSAGNGVPQAPVARIAFGHTSEFGGVVVFFFYNLILLGYQDV
jgi:hypothetical protein